MVDEYIRKVDMKDALQEKVFNNLTDEFYGAMQMLDELQPADVVPVVRCKDCKYVYCHIYHGWQEPIYTCTHLRSRWNSNNDLDVNPDNFCSYGERKED